jgi:hypothetical protein
MSGQINPHTPFGDQLVKLARHPDYYTYLDVGTWNGQGSTKILVDNCLNKRIYSVEANQSFYKIASDFYKPCPENLFLLWGKLSRSMMSSSQIECHPLFNVVKEHYRVHYKQDCIDFTRAPIVNLPAYADVVILDGGEFCGEGDLERTLTLNPIVIALDDTKVMKNNDNNKKLKNMGWTLLASGDDRNGWSIWKCPDDDKKRYNDMYRYLDKYLELPNA